MARKWSNLNIPGALHYLTGNVVNRIPIFKRNDCCTGFFEVFSELLSKWPCKVVTYVVMPDHFHLILNPQDGDIRGFGGALKSLTARKLIEITGGACFRRPEPDADGSIHQVWQESFKAFPLWSAWMIWQKINYIHANPLRARLVRSAKDYQWSSFRAFYMDSKEPIPVDYDWWWSDDSEKLSKAMKELGWRSYHHREGEKE